MAVVNEVVTLADGRTLNLKVTEEEFQFLLAFAVNTFISQGILAVNGIPEKFIELPPENTTKQ